MDSTLPGAEAHGFDAYRNEWEARFGTGLPTYSSDTARDFRVRAHAVRMHDVMMVDIHGASGIQTVCPSDEVEKEIQLYVVSRGAYVLGGPSGTGARTVSAGQFLLERVGKPERLDMAPHTTAKVLATTPSPALVPLLRNRTLTGPADSAEIRLLLAHMKVVRATREDLGPSSAFAASALLELVKAVAVGQFDDIEPSLTPALTQAAKDLADRKLADPELSPAVLARDLNVSIRTLQRAFAAAGESVATYIRHRRLEEAKRALTAPNTPLSISELAAYWQFSDRSHFIRAFKKTYGLTPTEYARSTP
ncbi:helix-turn-helix domain-containing protein [Nocardia sp. NBC_01499]|uniref:helix-turn-helix domain-containing protein n=1 Tax=Nocardia sp. NBC_01499 TaxID=2903597 RepID=UPI00386AAAB3